jgi:hypothetical protein
MLRKTEFDKTLIEFISYWLVTVSEENTSSQFFEVLLDLFRKY